MDISEEDYAKWMKMMERYISMRTAGIMDANRRNYYGECAAYIALMVKYVNHAALKVPKPVSWKDTRRNTQEGEHFIRN